MEKHSRRNIYINMMKKKLTERFYFIIYIAPSVAQSKSKYVYDSYTPRAIQWNPVMRIRVRCTYVIEMNCLKL